MLLSDEAGALQVLSLTLLLPAADISNITITIFLSLSFSARCSDIFTSQLTQPETFQVFQHAMLSELTAFEQSHGQGTSLEDYVVILQKATSRDAASIIQLLDTRLIEKLHSLLQQTAVIPEARSEDEETEDNKENSAMANKRQ